MVCEIRLSDSGQGVGSGCEEMLGIAATTPYRCEPLMTWMECLTIHGLPSSKSYMVSVAHVRHYVWIASIIHLTEHRLSSETSFEYGQIFKPNYINHQNGCSGFCILTDFVCLINLKSILD
ncbi:hypothetical protein PoB_006245400 [Plakobranchus ocellatus]|uniref:Uncharacterized protein n=1 Tax=Plakobranchus ocellatus TaxID=259542 RepID=A0AAV4CVN4_9GAST|nr:hypothetical protein PoB_006245400 [Plakobranchus ocellatus]